MTDEPDAVADATQSFLDDFDDGEQVLETVLEVDAVEDGWTFDDIALDSGTFGELVSRGLVEDSGNGYRVADREVVEAVLAGEDVRAEDETDWRELVPSMKTGLWLEPRALGGLVLALLLVFVMRITQYSAVFRGDDVVSPGNDPYYYRYWMAELLAESTSSTDFGLLGAMPTAATNRRPLSHALHWWFATVLGGDSAAADLVAAWLPVVATLALAVVIYATAVVITRDVRIGLASVIVFAVAPVHAVYTQVGFLEHRLHQYFWLGVTLLTLAWLAVDVSRRRERGEPIRGHLQSPMTWLVALVLGWTLGISIHLWGGSPLLFFPLAVYIGLRAVVDAREGVSPLLANLPLLVALVIGSGISGWLHLNWGWQPGFVAFTPAMVLGGALVVFALGEVWRYLEWHGGALVILEGLVAGTGFYVFRRIRPEDWAEARARADDLLLREGYTESVSLFTTEYMVIFGPLVQLGVSFYLGMAVLAWAVWLCTRRYEPAWVLLSVYTVVLMVLAGIQIRFAAQFMVPLSVLGGVGLVYALSSFDLVRRPAMFLEDESMREGVEVQVPDRERATYIVVVLVLVCGLSLLFAPGLSSQVSHGDGEYAAVQAIQEHAESTDREYPENFVLSEWGDNRMYNYHVNGESQGYGYARSNYNDFRYGENPDSYYDQFEGRVGYVVVTSVDSGVRSETVQGTLLENMDIDDLAHYQLLTVDDDRSAAGYAVVPGATINASGEPGETVTVSTTVSVDGTSIEYERDGVVGEDGFVEIVVAYPGEYAIGDETLEVTESDVENGSVVESR